MAIEIVTAAARPDLIDLIARWIWMQWGNRKGRPLDGIAARMRTRVAAVGPEQIFILLEDGAAVATASLVRDDLDERPDLTPWLASVYVDPPARGRGHATRLVRTVEDACVQARIPALWLHTEDAAGLYAKLGWHVVGPADDTGHPVTVMRRNLPEPPDTT
jgi:GNAT superfamily N-acetyltransferase